jgi:1-acyl-sn-glycerol-3-phosphate acyltransferase
MKREAAAAPIIGRSVIETECAFLARGTDKSGDLAEIAKCARTASLDNASVVIFPEGTRFRGPKEGSGFERVLPPKSGGLKVLLDEIPMYPVLSVTIAWNRDIRNGKDVASSLGTYNGARVTVSAEIVNRLQARNADEWLQNEWRRKDEVLSETG